jgi:hypothetical protein
MQHQKRHRDRRSIWWDHVEELALDTKHVKCKICSALISSSSTSNFSDHYQSHHKQKFQSIMAPNNTNSNQTNTTQTTLNSNGQLTQPIRVSHKVQKEIDYCVANMIIVDALPFATVEKKGRN